MVVKFPLSAAPSAAELAPAPDGAVFVSVGLPAQLAQELAGQYPVVELLAEELSVATLSAQSIMLIGCPLFGASFDAMQIAESLVAAGFTGRLLVVAPALPNVAMVERELQAMASPLTISLITP